MLIPSIPEIGNFGRPGMGAPPFQYLLLPGVAGNNASSPDSVALSVTGDLDIRRFLALPDWTPSSLGMLLSKWNTTGNQRSYQFFVNTNGTLALAVSADGSASSTGTSSVATGIADGDFKWVRATWRASDGRIQFLLSDDGVSWTQLGSDRAAAIGAIFDSTAAVEVGTNNGGSSNPLAAQDLRAQIYSGIGGTLVFDSDFAEIQSIAPGGTTMIEKSSNAATVTINTSGSNIAKILRV